MFPKASRTGSPSGCSPTPPNHPGRTRQASALYPSRQRPAGAVRQAQAPEPHCLSPHLGLASRPAEAAAKPAAHWCGPRTLALQTRRPRGVDAPPPAPIPPAGPARSAPGTGSVATSTTGVPRRCRSPRLGLSDQLEAADCFYQPRAAAPGPLPEARADGKLEGKLGPHDEVLGTGPAGRDWHCDCWKQAIRNRMIGVTSAKSGRFVFCR